VVFFGIPQFERLSESDRESARDRQARLGADEEQRRLRLFLLEDEILLLHDRGQKWEGRAPAELKADRR
jgi:hypothetical protein